MRVPICVLHLRRRCENILLHACLLLGEICILRTILNCIALARLHAEMDLAYFQILPHSSSLIETLSYLSLVSPVIRTTVFSNRVLSL